MKNRVDRRLRTPPPRGAGAGVVASLALVLAFAGSLARAQSDADFLAAKDAFERGDRRRLDTAAPALSPHTLAPYIAYWPFKSGLDAADYDAVRAFLTQNAGTPLADRLRVEWLKVLG